MVLPPELYRAVSTINGTIRLWRLHSCHDAAINIILRGISTSDNRERVPDHTGFQTTTMWHPHSMVEKLHLE